MTEMILKLSDQKNQDLMALAAFEGLSPAEWLDQNLSDLLSERTRQLKKKKLEVALAHFDQAVDWSQVEQVSDEDIQKEVDEIRQALYESYR